MRSPSLEVFKTGQDKALTPWCDSTADFAVSRMLDHRPPEVWSGLSYSEGLRNSAAAVRAEYLVLISVV